MKPTAKKYQIMAERAVPPTTKLKNLCFAFLIGGAICGIGQGIQAFYESLKMGADESKTALSMTMIFLGALLTALHVYNKLAKYGGAGTLVPITGFSNAMVSPAIEFKKEGHILGIGAKMFTIAGPVIVFGLITSVLYGLIRVMIP